MSIFYTDKVIKTLEVKVKEEEEVGPKPPVKGKVLVKFPVSKSGHGFTYENSLGPSQPAGTASKLSLFIFFEGFPL